MLEELPENVQVKVRQLLKAQGNVFLDRSWKTVWDDDDADVEVVSCLFRGQSLQEVTVVLSTGGVHGF